MTAGEVPDLRAELREGMRSLAAGSHRAGQGSTSDLSVDEVLLLHSIGWEPVDLVCGASVASIGYGAWQWGTGEIEAASVAHTHAVTTAGGRLRAECREVGGAGVVGVRMDVEVHPYHVDVVMVGTAVRPRRGGGGRLEPFVSDLSTRDFALLHGAGWEPRGLAFGAAYVFAPRRSVTATVQQRRQNVEQTNYTEALYAARESAMERMQRAATELGAQGVVAVRITDGPIAFAGHVAFAGHAIGFTAWGTAVGLGAGGHTYLRPRLVLPLDDATPAFDARSLRR